jgi:hypothetical protein
VIAMRGVSLGVLLAIVLGGCGSDDDPAPLPADFALSIERSLCFGLCPVYSASVDATGRVNYQGERNVRVRGPQVDQVAPAALRRLLADMQRSGFFALEDKYWYWGEHCPQLVSDGSTVTVTVTRRGATQRIHHYLGCLGDPVVDDLAGLELEIDATLNTLAWIACKPSDTVLWATCDV